MSSDLQGLAEQAAGNWKRFECVAWWDDSEDQDQRCIVYTHNRDSCILDQSNAAAIEEELRPFFEDGSVDPQRHSHWACGWIDGYSILVYDKAGNITPAFRKWRELQDEIDDYLVLDYDDLSEREHAEALLSIELCRPRDSISNLPEGWEEEVSSWMWDHNIGDGYISEEDVRQAFEEFGWTTPSGENVESGDDGRESENEAS